MISAQRSKFGKDWNYFIGNYRIIHISKEEYDALQNIKREYTLEDEKRYIIYMNDFPSEIIKNYSQRIIDELGENKHCELLQERKELESKLMFVDMEIRAIQELEKLVKDALG